MFKEIFLFELQYRKARPATYIYFSLIFLLAFLIVVSPTTRLAVDAGQVKANSPFVISTLILVFSLLFTMITSAVMGVSVVRDFENNTEAMLFSTPIRKIDYLMGRFLGSMFIVVIIHAAVIFGLMAGFMVGDELPWDVSWKKQGLLPFNLWYYFQPFLLFSVSNIFVTGALFFMSGALGRNTLVIYSQGILLLILYLIGNVLIRDLDMNSIAALIDPFGIQTFQETTRYWTAIEKNTRLVPFTGSMLYNRLIWILIGVFSLIITHLFFSFSPRKSLLGRRINNATALLINPESIVIRYGKQVVNAATYLRQLIHLSFFHFRFIVREIPFMVIVGSGLLLLVVNTLKLNQVYGTSSYPTTYSILLVLTSSFDLFFTVIVVFYSGELVWKERSVRLNLIMDAIPIPNFINLLSKFFGLLLVYIVLMFLLIVSGVTIQASLGYYEFNFPAYFGTLFTQTLSTLVLLTALSLLIQVLVNNKFLGFALTITLIVINSVLGQFGIEHDLLQFGSGSLGPYSDMNSYGHFITPFFWFRFYWTAFAIILLLLGMVSTVRGSESTARMRWKSIKGRIRRSILVYLGATIILFASTGTYIYYNTNVLNSFKSTWTKKEGQAQYETTFKQYELIDQPKITVVSINLELYPYQRNFTATGFYYLKNKTDHPIADIHIQQNKDIQIISDEVSFDRPSSLTNGDTDQRYFIYRLSPALLPGDSVKMSFSESFQPEGFREGESNTAVVYNGSMLSNAYFPTLGYDKNVELFLSNDRFEHNLKQYDTLTRTSGVPTKSNNVFGNDADRIRLEITVSTDSNQVAVAPGHLERTWTQGNRKSFQYKLNGTMPNFYSIISGRYAVHRDKWKDVDLEIYYHPGHEFNLAQMMNGMKAALDYNTTNFGPYQYKELRIVEFPRYATFAKTFANTIPFSEGVSFILKAKKGQRELDVPYYMTLHETSHQWWGNQLMEADSEGGGMLSESLSQYSALMVLKHTVPEEMMERYLKYELNAYLTGRGGERTRERPLQFVQQQNYIQTNKATLVFYALQDYIGEENINKALRQFMEKWKNKEAPYPTSRDLINAIKEVTPDSLQYLLVDLVETVTVFENKAVEAMYEEKSPGEFEVTLNVSCAKFRVNDKGTEQPIAINDWIDVGIYSKDKDGVDRLIYLKKHKISKNENIFNIIVHSRPEKAGIDPLHKLIDRHTEDNTLHTGRVVDIINIL